MKLAKNIAWQLPGHKECAILSFMLAFWGGRSCPAPKTIINFGAAASRAVRRKK